MAKELPPQQYLQECFSYDSEMNQLTRKERPASHFKDEAMMKLFSHNHAGEIAGSKTGQVNLDRVSYAKKNAYYLE